jgi:hypothetical protein
MLDVSHGESWFLTYLVNEHPRHAYPDAGMLTMAAPSGTGGHTQPTAGGVTSAGP